MWRRGVLCRERGIFLMQEKSVFIVEVRRLLGTSRIRGIMGFQL